MGTRMTFVTSVGFLLAFLALVSAEDEPTDDVAENGINVVAVIDDYIPEYDIDSNMDTKTDLRVTFECHECMKHKHGPDCVTMKNTTKLQRKTCAQGEFCTIEWEKVEGELTMFNRGCVNKCKTGCRVADGPYSLEKCQECCEEHLCNYMPASAHKVMTSSLFVVLVTIANRLHLPIT